jgi:hypothetical protein
MYSSEITRVLPRRDTLVKHAPRGRGRSFFRGIRVGTRHVLLSGMRQLRRSCRVRSNSRSLRAELSRRTYRRPPVRSRQERRKRGKKKHNARIHRRDLSTFESRPGSQRGLKRPFVVGTVRRPGDVKPCQAARSTPTQARLHSSRSRYRLWCRGSGTNVVRRVLTGTTFSEGGSFTAFVKRTPHTDDTV